MPELPEIETVRRGLTKIIIGKTIKYVQILHKNIIEGEENNFIDTLKNQKIIEIQRKAKYLIFWLSGDYLMLAHLGMEGKFIPGNSAEEKSKYLRVLFTFQDGSILNFDDSRCFGYLSIRNKKNYLTSLPLSKLGEDANNPKLDINRIYKKIHKSSRTIKETLLDQSVVAGLGNIYVDETLFQAKISPLSKANLLTKKEIITILKCAKEVLESAIEHNGTTVFSFSWNKGHEGEFQKYLKAYGRKDKPCERCKSALVKIFVGGRGTTYCPKCQKLKTDKYILGITGPVSVGKSTALKIFKKAGYKIYSADEAVNKLYLDQDFKMQLKKIFGVTSKDEIRKIVNDNPNKLHQLNALIHPLIKIDIKKFINSYSGYLALEIPLLFQTNLNQLMDETLLILSNQSKELINTRKHAEEQLKINQNLNFNRYKNKATYVIYNQKSLNIFVKNIKNIIKNS